MAAGLRHTSRTAQRVHTEACHGRGATSPCHIFATSAAAPRSAAAISAMPMT
jgi:hypothetical protein